ncbi:MULTISPECIES: hypothetical protein [Streptomyces rochei group]|uniref:hypothetical protein n=1 Tax=Streptomyces rochei group TaxID=2867164 RepID=UPI0018735B56|nr:hypothetical protein [Streptomyces vinaceusdrappus]GHC36729.1 hypothetical protein GCM10010308_63990 [Streptomyces vinaceusdrappus]
MTTPTPMGCAACGIARRDHGRQHTESAGWHAWQQPTQQQMKDRILARRAPRLSARAIQEGIAGAEATQATRRELENQLYAEDPSDRADAYLALRAMEGEPDAS